MSDPHLEDSLGRVGGEWRSVSTLPGHYGGGVRAMVAGVGGRLTERISAVPLSGSF